MFSTLLEAHRFAAHFVFANSIRCPVRSWMRTQRCPLSTRRKCSGMRVSRPCAALSNTPLRIAQTHGLYGQSAVARQRVVGQGHRCSIERLAHRALQICAALRIGTDDDGRHVFRGRGCRACRDRTQRDRNLQLSRRAHALPSDTSDSRAGAIAAARHRLPTNRPMALRRASRPAQGCSAKIRSGPDSSQSCDRPAPPRIVPRADRRAHA